MEALSCESSIQAAGSGPVRARDSLLWSLGILTESDEWLLLGWREYKKSLLVNLRLPDWVSLMWWMSCTVHYGTVVSCDAQKLDACRKSWTFNDEFSKYICSMRPGIVENSQFLVCGKIIAQKLFELFESQRSSYFSQNNCLFFGSFYLLSLNPFIQRCFVTAVLSLIPLTPAFPLRRHTTTHALPWVCVNPHTHTKTLAEETEIAVDCEQKR